MCAKFYCCVFFPYRDIAVESLTSQLCQHAVLHHWMQRSLIDLPRAATTLAVAANLTSLSQYMLWVIVTVKTTVVSQKPQVSFTECLGTTD